MLFLLSVADFLLGLIVILILLVIIGVILIPSITFIGHLISMITEKQNWASKLHKKLF